MNLRCDVTTCALAFFMSCACAVGGRAYGANGVAIDEKNVITAVDARRTYDEFILDRAVSTSKTKEITVVEDDEKGKKVNVYPFHGVHVKRLVVRTDTTGAKGVAQLEAKSFLGMEGLEEIVFENGIPKFTEDTGWTGKFFGRLFTNTDWRKGVRKIVLRAGPSFPLENVAFIDDIKCIEFTEETAPSIGLFCANVSAFARCRSLERLILPYQFACNTNLAWGEMIRRSSLKDREVMSVPSTNESHDVVLLNAPRSGDVSDCVTEIRADAVEGWMGERLYLPFSLRRFLGRPAADVVNRFTLKKDSVSFYPDILDANVRKKLEQSRSLFSEQPLSIATPYRNLALEDTVHSLTSRPFNSRGTAFTGDFNLIRDEKGGARCSVSAFLNMGGERYPVRFHPSAGLGDGRSIEITFAHPRTGIGYLIGASIVWVVGALALSFVLWRIGKKRRMPRKAVGGAIASCLFALFLFVFGSPRIGLIQHFADLWLTGTAISYLNASFISSLVISVTASLTQMVIGILQGINITPMGIGVDFHGMLQPVQDVLGRIASYSWISTAVLASLRLLCQLLKDFAAPLWMGLGASWIALVFMRCRDGHGMIVKLAGVAVCGLAFLALGLPLLLCGCSVVSGELSLMAGNAFAEAMGDFKALADSFTFRSLLSLSAIQALMAQFTDAVSTLMSASILYLATKAFDCFLVPLSIYFLFKRAMKGCSENRDEILARVQEGQRELKRELALYARGVYPAAMMPSAGTDGAIGQAIEQEATTALVPQVVVPEVVEADVVRDVEVASAESGWLPRFIRTTTPYTGWITACGVMLLFVVCTAGFFSRSPVTVVQNPSAPQTQMASPMNGAAPLGSMDVAKTKKSNVGAVWAVSLLGALAFILLDFALYKKALHQIKEVEDSVRMSTPEKKLELLEDQGFWFDLPLYAGLFGTVVGFLIISFNETWAQGGRFTSYFSTIAGILTTALINWHVSKCRISLKEKVAE